MAPLSRTALTKIQGRLSQFVETGVFRKYFDMISNVLQQLDQFLPNKVLFGFEITHTGFEYGIVLAILPFHRFQAIRQ